MIYSAKFLIGLLYRVRNLLDFNSKMLFYNSYILPYIDYCLTIWGQATKDTIEKIHRLQKRAGKTILNVDKMCSIFIRF